MLLPAWFPRTPVEAGGGREGTRNGRPNQGSEAAAAPATVSGERAPERHWETGKAGVAPRPASQETCHAASKPAVGRTAKETRPMNSKIDSSAANAATPAKSGSTLAAAIVAAGIGMAIIAVAGHAQSETLHDAAHDTRHAAGFPCH